MGFQSNATLQTTFGRKPLTVKKKLGEGGQGEVYLVTDGSHDYALKWYYEEQSTPDQDKAIRDLVQRGAPNRVPEAGKRFVWPLDLVRATGRREFGYLMPLIDMRSFAELGEVMGRRKPQPSPRVMCEVGYQLANSYRALHLDGLCYRDISQGNMMFDPKTGEVLICDNDNVGVNRQSKSQIMGTWEFMAPEVILGKADPSTDTDLHSLAVLLFQLWTWHHPMHGDLECAFRSWDIPAKKRVYGEKPVFIFDPNDASNRPNDPDYGTVRQRWAFCPPLLKATFQRAFGVGLREPGKRVTEGEWQQLFLQLKEGAILCPKCTGENLWDLTMQSLSCWNCKSAITIPGRLRINTGAGDFHLLLTPQMELKAFHLWPSGGRDGKIDVLGKMVQNPNNPSQWGIRNLSSEPWSVVFADGTQREIVPQKAVPLSGGAKIKLCGKEAEIQA